jgi:hypothetical protein
VSTVHMRSVFFIEQSGCFDGVQRRPLATASARSGAEAAEGGRERG